MLNEVEKINLAVLMTVLFFSFFFYRSEIAVLYLSLFYVMYLSLAVRHGLFSRLLPAGLVGLSLASRQPPPSDSLAPLFVFLTYTALVPACSLAGLEGRGACPAGLWRAGLGAVAKSLAAFWLPTSAAALAVVAHGGSGYPLVVHVTYAALFHAMYTAAGKTPLHVYALPQLSALAYIAAGEAPGTARLLAAALPYLSAALAAGLRGGRPSPG